jgi:hypothetical protein
MLLLLINETAIETYNGSVVTVLLKHINRKTGRRRQKLPWPDTKLEGSDVSRLQKSIRVACSFLTSLTSKSNASHDTSIANQASRCPRLHAMVREGRGRACGKFSLRPTLLAGLYRVWTKSCASSPASFFGDYSAKLLRTACPVPGRPQGYKRLMLNSDWFVLSNGFHNALICHLRAYNACLTAFSHVLWNKDKSEKLYALQRDL